MERRQDKRWPKRLSVRFWEQGDTKASPGYSTNISKSGIFIRTVSPFPKGTRLRIEIFQGQIGFMIEGEVARSIKVPAHLQSVRQPGMGVRFLPVDELLGDLVPARAEPQEETTQPPADAQGTRPLSVPPQAPTPAPESPSRPAYRVVFKTRNQYMSVFQRDLINGGLFVATSKPAALEAKIDIEISVRESDQERIRLTARVVHRIDPEIDDHGDTNLMAGMGVEFVDSKRAVKLLTDLATSLF